MSGSGIRPTGRGVLTLTGVVVLGAAAYLGGLPELIYAAALAASLCLVGLAQILFGAAGRPPTVDRQISTSAPFVSQSVTIDLRVNAGRAPSAGTWKDRLSGDLHGTAEGEAARLNDGVRYEAVPGRRGWHRAGPCDITRQDVFALWRHRRVAGSATDLLVLPALEVFTENGPVRPHGETPEFSHAGQAMRDPDIIPREYRPGDPLSRIHWKATARREQLMVRDDERKADLSALLVLDLRRAGEPEAVERAVSMTASVLTHLVDAGYSVRLRGLGCQQRIDGEIDGSTGLLDAMRALAVVEPGGAVEAPPRGSVRLAIVVGPRPRPWPVRAAEKFAVTTGSLTDDDRSLAEPMGWRSAPFDHTGSPARTWADLGRGYAGPTRG